MKWSMQSLKSDFTKIQWYKKPKLIASAKLVLSSIVACSLVLYFLDLTLYTAVSFVKWVLRFILG